MADEPRRTEDLQEEEPVEKIDLGASLRKEHKAKKPVNRLAVLVTARRRSSSLRRYWRSSCRAC